MIRKDFSRSFLRMGYDASEVLSFLVDIERTITGEETDPKKVITAQKAEDQEFSVKWRGFNDEEVDMEIDRLIQALRVPRCQSRPRRIAQLCRSRTRPLRCLRLTISSRHRLWRFLMPSRWPCPPSMPISARRRPLMTFFVP